MKTTGHLHPHEMANWTQKSQHLHSNPSGELFFPARAVFFANSATAASTGDDDSAPNAKKKKSNNPLDNLTQDASAMIDATLHATSSSELEGQLKSLLAKEKISQGTYDTAHRFAMSSRFLDQELTRQLIKGKITQDQFKQYASYLHPDTGDAANRASQQKLAEQTIFGKIKPHQFEKAAHCLESDSIDHKRAADAFIKDPNRAKEFAEFLLKNPLKKEALRDLPGATALDVQQDILGRELATFKAKKVSDVLREKVDTPESAEKVKGLIREFEETSKSHSEHWNQLTTLFQQISKGDKQVEQALENAISDTFPEPVHQDEKDISLADIEKSFKKTKLATRIDLAKIIPSDVLRNLHQKVVTLQKISRKAAEVKANIDTEIAWRQKEVLKRQAMKRELQELQRQSGININPGTPLRYRKETTLPGSPVKKYEWDTAEIQDVTMELVAEAALNEQAPVAKEMMMVHVEGVGAFSTNEFIKWVTDRQASQEIKSREVLNRETEYQVLGLPLLRGSILSQPVRNIDGEGGAELRKVEKITDDGHIELDKPIIVAQAGDTIEGVPLSTPLEKKRLSFGECAQWIRRNHVTPHLKTLQEAEIAYNNWRKEKTTAASATTKFSNAIFQKGAFLTYGPYEQKNILYIKDVAIDAKTGEQTITINNTTFTASEVLRSAMSMHWEPLNDQEYATQATANITNPMQRAEAYTRALENIQNHKAHHVRNLGITDAAAQASGGNFSHVTAPVDPSLIAKAGAPAIPQVMSEASHGSAPISPTQSHTPAGSTIKHGGGGGGGGSGGGHGGGGSNSGPDGAGDHGKDEKDTGHGSDKKNSGKHDSKKDEKNVGHDNHEEEPLIPKLETIINPPNPEEDAKDEKKKQDLKNQIDKNTDMPSQSELRQLWVDTNVLSLQEMWQLGKHIWEYWERTWERRMKGRFSKFGANLPFIGTEMLRIKEETEHHEVGQFKEAMTNMGIIEVRGLLNRSSNADQIKACIEVLTEKGQMRWDDVRTWDAINRISHLPGDKKIPIPKDRNPYSPVGIDEKTGAKKMGMEYLGQAIDSLWGDSQYEGWQNKSSSAYESGMKGFDQQGAELENDPYGTGKIAGRLQNLLKTHMAGEWANPQEYEGFIRYIIAKGKSTAENKLFFIVAGVATGILTLERMGAIADDLQNNLPFLAFLAEGGEQKPYQSKAGPYSVEELQKMFKVFMEDPGITKPKDMYKAGPKVKDFMWKYALTNSEAQTRTIKAIRNGEANIDHDDAHLVIPLLDEEWIKQVCSHSGGRKKYFTIPGYVNAFPGFAEWVKTLSGTYTSDPERFAKKNRANLIQGIKSFVNYNGILSNRFEKENKDYQRLAKEYLEKPSVVDGHPVKNHKEQMERVIIAIGREFNIKDHEYLNQDTPKNYKDNPEQLAKQKKIENAHLEFGDALEKAIKDDPKNADARLIRAIESVGLWGFNYTVDTAAQEKAKQASLNLGQKADEAASEEAMKKKGDISF